MRTDAQRVGVVLPTRGLIFTETIDALLKQTDEIFLSHNLPIPDSFNQLVEKALGYDYIFITNDDVVIPDGAITKMLAMDEDVVIGKVPMIQEYQGYYEKDGKVTMFGTACLLVKRSVFDKLTKPYFETKYRYITQGKEEKVIIDEKAWGGEDVYFSRKVIAAGIEPKIADVTCRHLRLEQFGEHTNNHGCHKIGEL